MRLQTLAIFTFLFCKSVVFSQTTVSNPSKKDFSGTLTFLASDWMEGREATKKGGFMAADYIASIMGLYQLIPYNKNTNSDYFQDFKIQEHLVKKASFEIKKGTKESIILSSENDFQVTPISQSLQKEAQIVFVGYGLNISKEGYDDYKNLNIKDKIVVGLKGFPGHQDSTSVNYKKLKPLFPEENDLEETKLQTAINKGAIALIIVDAKGNFKPLAINDSESINIENKRIVSNWFDIKKNVLPFGNIYFNKRIYKTASGFQRAFINKYYKC